MKAPWLWNLAFVTELDESALLAGHTEHLGEAAFDTDALQAVLAALPPADVFLHAEAYRVWLACVAREVLLAAATGDIPASAVPETLLSCAPFGNDGPRLRDLLGARVAACVFPLDGSICNHSPAKAQLWLFRWKAAAQGCNPVLQDWLQMQTSDFRSCVVGAPRDFSGPSWQLGASLALRLAQEYNPAVLLTLARDWIVTGAVLPDGWVERVALGNKLELVTRRQWLLPAGNARDVPQGFVPFRGLQYVGHLDAALARVSGDGVIDGGESTEHLKADKIHTLVGHTREAVLGLLLALKPAQAWLWHSHGTEQQAGDIKNIMGQLSPSTICVLRLCASDSVRKAERSFLTVMGDALQAGSDVCFNITSSNRLSSFAVLNIARSYPNLRMVYRDIDAEPFAFTMLRFEGYQPTSVLMTVAEEQRDAGINWDIVFSRPGEKEVEPWESLARRLRAGGGED